MADSPDPLERLAAACGIGSSWRDNWGGEHPTGARTAAGLLAAMGVAASSPAEARASLAQLEESSWCETLPPVLVVRVSALPESFPLALPRPPRGERPARSGSPAIQVEVREEDGNSRRARFEAGALARLGSRRFRGRTWDRFAVPLPGPFPLGYHTLRLTVLAGGRSLLQREVPLIVCPARAWSPPEAQDDGRAAGIGVALYGLRSARNAGIGDFGDLRRFTRWAVAELGVAFIGLNPLHATRNRYPYGHSPYLPLSALFGNHLYLELEAVPEFAQCAEARRLMAHGGGLLARLRAAEHVPYAEADRFKLRVLRALFKEFLRCRDRAGWCERRRRFEDYLAAEGEPLARFALFQAIDAHLAETGGRCWSWRQWPAEYRRPDAGAAREFLERRREEVLFWQYAQWLLDEQLDELDRDARARGLRLGYYHDLAMAVDEHGADVWAAQELFAAGARVGAPPDDFNSAGQDWGFPPPHPQRDRAQGYRAFAEQIRRACRHAGLLRIDHVMRLARLFWIPAGMPAAEGAYVGYRQEEFFGIVALESVRNRTVIVGEDLGVVPDGFRETMDAEGLCSCRLLWFERDHGGAYRPPREYPRNAMVSITSHDLATLAGFWSGRDLESRLEIGLFPTAESYAAALECRRRDRRRLVELLVAHGALPAERLAEAGNPAEPDGELHNAVIGLLCDTPSRYFLLAQEDLFKVRDQQNVPGTVAERPNWVWRMPWTVEELESEPAVRDYALMYRNNLRRSGRLVSSGSLGRP